MKGELIMEKIVVNFEPQDFGDKNQYHYNAQLWRYGRGTWWYTGSGRYLKTIEEVLLYARNQNVLIEFK